MTLLVHPAAGWQIRIGDDADFASIEAVFIDCMKDFPWREPPHVELQRLKTAFSGPLDCFVAEEKSAGVIGFLTLERAGGYVPHLFVHRDWRFCGIADGLLGLARGKARRALELDVDVENHGALKAYEALGWTQNVNIRTAGVRQRRLTGP